MAWPSPTCWAKYRLHVKPIGKAWATGQRVVVLDAVQDVKGWTDMLESSVRLETEEGATQALAEEPSGSRAVNMGAVGEDVSDAFDVEPRQGTHLSERGLSRADLMAMAINQRPQP